MVLILADVLVVDAVGHFWEGDVRCIGGGGDVWDAEIAFGARAC